MKEELFDDLILERGYEYAQEGAVDHVRKVGEIIYATVHGTEDYHVKIDDNDMFCDCPYAKEGAHCKHMAAVLYYLDTLKELRNIIYLGGNKMQVVKRDGRMAEYNRERILKAIKKKQHATYKGNPIPLRAVLSGEILHYRVNGKIYLKD